MPIFSKEALKGKHILITGATGGIGYETAKVIASMGASISVTGRNKKTLEQLILELLNISGEKHFFMKAADISNHSDRFELVEECHNRLGPITGLVNAAAVAGKATVENLEEDFVRNVMEINYTSIVMLTKLIYQKMLERKEGAIVNVSSLSGLRGTYGNTAYSASKFALIGFTQSMALEAIKANIRVNAVCPGFVDTNMARDLIMHKAQENGRLFEEQLKEIEKGIPSGHMSTTTEVANTIAFLLTDAASNIVGESVKISGGSVMR